MKKTDLTGQKFGRLTVVKESTDRKHGKIAWDCLCECGNLVSVVTSHLPKIKSCGCYRSEPGRNKINLLNQKFGALLVVAEAENIGNFSAWLCRCDCGNEKVIKSSSLSSGKSVTCGCKITKFINQDPKMSSAKIIFNDKYSDGDLTFDDFYKMSQQNCFYCNIPPFTATNRLDTNSRNSRRKRDNQFSGERGTFIYNGLDRIDPLQNHNINNVVPCCKHCNRAKLAMTIDEFRNWVIRIYEFWIKEKAQ